MAEYSLFLESRPIGDPELKKFPPELIEAPDEWAASAIATERADSLYPAKASEVLIRIVGEQVPGRPIAEIRRPISN